MNLPRVYIAGPFRADTPWLIEQNIRRAEGVGLSVACAGAVPVIPHSMYRYFQDSRPDAFWLNACLTLLEPCQAVMVAVLPEEALASEGTLGEITHAQQVLNLPVFYHPIHEDVVAFCRWLKNYQEGAFA